MEKIFATWNYLIVYYSFFGVWMIFVSKLAFLIGYVVVKSSSMGISIICINQKLEDCGERWNFGSWLLNSVQYCWWKKWKHPVLLDLEIPVLLGKIMAGQPTPAIRPFWAYQHYGFPLLLNDSKGPSSKGPVCAQKYDRVYLEPLPNSYTVKRSWLHLFWLRPDWVVLVGSPDPFLGRQS